MDDNGNEYEKLLEALSKEYSGGLVKIIEGGLPKCSLPTPKGTRRPRYVGYGHDNEELCGLKY